MHDENDRYTRQRRLREIGDAGQARLEAARTVVTGGAEAMAEFVYLQRAGVGAVTIDSLGRPRDFPHASAFRHAAARSHAAASWRALETIIEIAGARRPNGASS